MTRIQCIPARLDQYVNHDPRLIFKAWLVFKARPLLAQLRQTAGLYLRPGFYSRKYGNCQAYFLLLLTGFRIFLKSRKFRVRVNSSFSLWDTVTSGIPRGSVLGPLLFLIYINDLVECCDPYCEIYLFADDANLFRHIVNPDDNYSIQKGTDALQCWSQQWLLKLNISKCSTVSFGRSVDKSYMYSIPGINQNTLLDHKDSFKDLGVVIDEKLTFRDHMHDKIN